MNTDYLMFNGIDGSTGKYLLPPLPPQDLSAIIQGEVKDPSLLGELAWWYQQTTEAGLGPIFGVDPLNLAETGWAVIFARDADPAIREALQLLLEHRRGQATGNNEQFYQEVTYIPGESKGDFLARHGAGPGPPDPHNIPYYLLIVGDPETIPFSFQYLLDVQYAVGRLYFRTPEEYCNYARSVVTAETGKAALSKQVVFFGVENPDDRATALSANELIKPLAARFQEQPVCPAHLVLKEEASKSRLHDFLGGKETPSLLFTASHGLSFPIGHPKQLAHQGALLCQDWPGPRKWQRAIPEDFYFSAGDIAEDANLQGLISFHFACYAAGTPRWDDFAHRALRQRAAIAPHAFIAQLPQRILGIPRGALAVVAHVDRAWGYSFLWEGAGGQLQVFEDVLKRLMEGHPLGFAMEPFNFRYSELSTMLNQQLEEISFKGPTNDIALNGMWTANNDARNYIILGDPTVRLF